MFSFSPVETVLVASVITVIYSSMGGLKGVIVTDFSSLSLLWVRLFGRQPI